MPWVQLAIAQAQNRETVLTELSIDPTNQFIYHSSQVLVLLDILSTRNSNLYQNNLSNPFWVVAEEYLERMKLLGYTLDVIKTVNTDHQLDALELLFEGGNALLDLLLL